MVQVLSILQFDWTSLILFSGIVNSFFAIILLQKHYNFTSKSFFWLGCVLVCISLMLLERIIRFSELVDHFPYFLFLTSPLFFFIAPLMYSSQKELMGDYKQWPLHFIAPLLFLVLLLPSILLNPDEKLSMYHSAKTNDPIWIVLIYVVFSLFYSVKIFFLNKKYATQLFQEYADDSVSFQLRSNRMILFSSILLLTIPLSVAAQYLPISEYKFEKILFLVFSITPHIIFIALAQRRDVPLLPDESSSKDLEASAELKLSPSDLQILLDYMQHKKPYHDTSLTLQKLADEIQWSRSKLSFVINSGTGKNFYDFVNDYRLDWVLLEFSKGSHHQYSLDYLTQKAGFKSYATFYRFFKKRKNKAPQVFLKEL